MISLTNPVKGAILPLGSAPKPPQFRVTQGFGPTDLILEPALNWPGGEGFAAGFYKHFHRGLDLGNRGCNDPVLAMADGRVSLRDANSARGRFLVLDHGAGWISEYQHLQERFPQIGAVVSAGQPIGTVGDTGHSTACHLHVEVRSGVQDPKRPWDSGVWRDPWRFLEGSVLKPIEAPEKLRDVTMAANANVYDLSGRKLRDLAGEQTRRALGIVEIDGDDNHRPWYAVRLPVDGEARLCLVRADGTAISAKELPVCTQAELNAKYGEGYADAKLKAKTAVEAI